MHDARRGTPILLIDDDSVAAEALTRELTSRGYRVQHCRSYEALSALETGQSDAALVVVELMLRDADGLTVCAAIRAATAIPILVYSGTRRAGDEAAALRCGANAFVRKGGAPAELVTCIQSLLNPSAPTSRSARVTSGRHSGQARGLVLDLLRGRATLDGLPVQLTPIEAR